MNQNLKNLGLFNYDNLGDLKNTNNKEINQKSQSYFMKFKSKKLLKKIKKEVEEN